MGLEIVELLEGTLCLGLIVPEFWLGCNLLQVTNLGIEGRQVKDSPGFYPGGQTTVRLRA